MNDKIIKRYIHKCIDTQKKDSKHKKVNVFDTRVIKPFGIDDDIQIAFFLSIFAININKHNMDIVMPNIIALYLSNSKENFNKGKEILKEIIGKYTETENELTDNDNIKMYNCFQYFQTAIVFIYMAVESFANSCIKDDFEYQRIKNNGVKETYNKKAIEKMIPTSEKLTNIVPEVLKLENPNTKPFWADFKKLEALRDRIVHCKENAVPDLLQDIVNPVIESLIYSTLQLLQYYVENDKKNLIFPLGFGESIIPIFDIKDQMVVLKHSPFTDG